METIEEFYHGFCKGQNQIRTVLCEFEQREDGTRVLLEADCAYGACPHSRVCRLMAQALEPARGKI